MFGALRVNLLFYHIFKDCIVFPFSAIVFSLRLTLKIYATSMANREDPVMTRRLERLFDLGLHHLLKSECSKTKEKLLYRVNIKTDGVFSPDYA